MAAERRNHYRILFVQPEAPPEVIKAAWRALMSTLRAHPDLGGDGEQAARLNAAYAVLSDPQQRLAYDRSLRRPGRGAAAVAQAAVADPGCPFCGHALPDRMGRDSSCGACGSPLWPAPRAERHAKAEVLGRRRAERLVRNTVVLLRQPGLTGERRAQLRDLSLGGLALVAGQRLSPGSVFRVQAPQFDALALVVSCRAVQAGHSVHARLLTLKVLPGSQGAVLDLRA
ncbi:DnaJ-class molecular chaperone with C-terminal Zn finger domain [Burkholderiales bacterium JOSHI_001]|nr:DnaJ-class molecular chaperone with C-terminal Zn finger domain [Burkholderiales bacterium JOSHI_001]